MWLLVKAFWSSAPARAMARWRGRWAVAGSRASEGRRGEIIRCDERWRVALAARLAQAHQGPVAASETILENRQSKAALYAATGALVVDMESAVAARFALARKLPFAVVAGDFRRCRPCAAAGGAGGDETGWRHRAGPGLRLAAAPSAAGARADPHGAEFGQGVPGITPLPRPLRGRTRWYWTCRS